MRNSVGVKISGHFGSSLKPCIDTKSLTISVMLVTLLPRFRYNTKNNREAGKPSCLQGGNHNFVDLRVLRLFVFLFKAHKLEHLLTDVAGSAQLKRNKAS